MTPTKAEISAAIRNVRGDLLYASDALASDDLDAAHAHLTAAKMHADDAQALLVSRRGSA